MDPGIDSREENPADLREVLDALSFPVAAVDNDFRISRLNRTALKRTNINLPDNGLGKYCYSILYGRESVCPYCPYIDGIDNHNHDMIISSFEGGEEKLLRIMIGRHSPDASYFVETIEDITVLRQKNEEESRKENLAALGTMISGIAHELNNPLTGIGLTLQNLTANLSTMNRDEILVRLNHLHKDMNRASRIVADILSFASPTRPKLSAGDLTQVIHRAWGNVVRLYPLLSKRVEWIYEGPESEIIHINQEKIERLFINLFKNSIQAFDYASGSIRVMMSQSDQAIHIMIEDNAGGISRENLNRIFLPFYSTNRDGRGSGLGLTICHQIVKEHNGRIRVGSSDGKTRFYISLPTELGEKNL